MKTYEEIFFEFKQEVGSQLYFNLDELSNIGILHLPFKDSMGDNFVIRLSANNSHYVLDDGGLIKNALFIMSETIGGVKHNKLAADLVSSFEARFDRSEGVIQLAAKEVEIIPKLLHFTKLLLTLDTMLVEIERDERKEEKPHRISLGPRASQRIKKSLFPLIRAEKVSHRIIIDGLTVPDWMVDFAYKPVTLPLARGVELVILITVDLAVLDPIIKSAHAFSRAVDIRSAHSNYNILVAFDTHGQNSNAHHASEFLTQHQVDTKAYTAVNLSIGTEYAELVNRIGREAGMPLTS